MYARATMISGTGDDATAVPLAERRVLLAEEGDVEERQTRLRQACKRPACEAKVSSDESRGRTLGAASSVPTSHFLAFGNLENLRFFSDDEVESGHPFYSPSLNSTTRW